MKLLSYHALYLIGAIQNQISALIEAWEDKGPNEVTHQMTADLTAEGGDISLVYRYKPDLQQSRLRVAVVRLKDNYDAIDQTVEVIFVIDADGAAAPEYQGHHTYSCTAPGPGLAASALSCAIYSWLWYGFFSPPKGFELFVPNQND